MRISNFNQDLAIISRLADLPNATDGLTAEQLKAKFDEAGLLIQKWINETLLPQLKAENVPFTGTSELHVEDVQAAIELVHSQIKDASSGTIVNGSVTKEKLAAELLARVYGGRPWTAMDVPGSSQNPETDFPIGQVWLRPRFTVVNAAGGEWTGSGCTVVKDGHRLTVTGDGTVAAATMTQVLSGIGQNGDRAYILFDIQDKDPEITGLTISLNGEEARDAQTGIFETTLPGGGLTVEFTVTWPSTSLATGSFEIVNYAVVNVDQVVRQTADTKEIADWPAYLEGLLPLDTYTAPEEVYIQANSGLWWTLGASIQPVSRGGTGFGSIGAGEMVVGGEDDVLEKLAAASEENSFLQFAGGKPVWRSPAEAFGSVSGLRMISGSYQGTDAALTVTLPVEPKLLYIWTDEGVWTSGNYGEENVSDRPCLLANGATDAGLYYWTSGSGAWSVRITKVKLSKKTLTIDGPYFCNRAGKTYQWIAIM